MKTQKNNMKLREAGRKLLFYVGRVLFLTLYKMFQFSGRILSIISNKIKPHLSALRELIYKRACYLFDITL